MKRLLITTALVSTMAFAANAQGTDQGKPSQHPPESIMEKTTPEMKGPADAQEHGPTNRMDQAVPPMKSTDPKPSAQAPTTTAPSGTPVTLSEEQAKEWIGKPVYSSDGKNVGEVAEIKRDSSSQVSELQADIGGFLGFGETRVSVPTTQFQLDTDRVILSLKEAETNSLTRVVK